MWLRTKIDNSSSTYGIPDKKLDKKAAIIYLVSQTSYMVNRFIANLRLIYPTTVFGTQKAYFYVHRYHSPADRVNVNKTAPFNKQLDTRQGLGPFFFPPSQYVRTPACRPEIKFGIVFPLFRL